MLDMLCRVERVLPDLLRDPARWQSLFINYHPPVVERVWCHWEDVRVYLHRIHPCAPEAALYHPHPWPSAMRIVSGAYEMPVGYGVGDAPPPVAARLILQTGTAYEMTDPNGWHAVAPIGEPALTLMVTGAPWERSSPKSDRPLQALSPETAVELRDLFLRAYTLL